MSQTPDIPSNATGAEPARPVAAAALLLIALAAGALSLLPLRPPAPLAADAPADRFAAGRALEQLRPMASAPRPPGSPGHHRTRELLLHRLGELGLETEVQETMRAFFLLGDRLDVMPVRNVVGRLAGSDPTGAVLLMAHYDSVAHSPGAADDGAGVAALLETARALASGPPPRNDVVFLFTDSEELALFGARSFAEKHRWADDVSVVLNFEARGASGPSILFETGPVDARFVVGAAAALARPVANSFSSEVYRRLPNDTDFTVFRERGLPGFNFAFIGDYHAYHNAQDDIDRLSPASLQHHGANALALARHLGDADLGSLPTADRGAVWFNLPGLGLIVHPLSWVLPLTVLAVLLTTAVLVVGARRQRLRWPPLLLSLLPPLLALLAAGGVAYLIHRSAFAATPLPALALEGGWRPLWCAVGATVAVAVLAPALRRLGALHLTVAAAVLWLLLTVWAAVAAPATAHLLLWPTLAVLAFLLVQPGRDGRAAPSAAGLAVLLVAIAVTLLLWVPTLALVGIALAATPATAALASALLTALVTALLLPAAATVLHRRWPLAAALGAVAAVLLVAVVVGSGYGPQRPRPDSLIYLLDHPRGEALWVSADPQPDGWTARYLDGAQPRAVEDFFAGTVELPAAPAPVIDAAPPRVVPVAVEPLADGLRRWTLRVDSPRRAALVRVGLRTRGEAVLRSVFGTAPPEALAPAETLDLRVTAPPEEGFEVVVDAPESSELEVVVVDRSYGLPVLDGQPMRRPQGYRPSGDLVTDVVLILERARFDADSAEAAGS